MSKTNQFKRVAVYGRARGDLTGVQDSLTKLQQILQQYNIDILVEKSTADNFTLAAKQVIEFAELSQCDLLIVVGGDGSLLQAARSVVKSNTPVIGINRGRLGFLTDILPDEIDKQLSKILSGQYFEEKRFLLDASLNHDSENTYTGTALNDVVLMPGDVAHMLEFDIVINQHIVCQQRADGIIIATPTGSTAYALSGGGPIMPPTLDAIVLVPMFPHTLSSRPIVVDANSEITINIKNSTEASSRLSCDGQKSAVVKPGQQIQIRKHPQYLKLIHPASYNYFETLRSKLAWEKTN